MSNRKKVAVIFIYLQNNLGDDLFLQQLCLRYPNVDFYAMPTFVSNKMLEGLDNLYFSEQMKTYFKEFNLPKLSDKLKKFYNSFDACIILGGSIFMQFNQAWRQRLRNFKNRTSLNKNTYIIGANFGPYTDAAFLTEHTEVFKGVKDLCFRDSVSASYFPDADNIRFAPDILFAYKYKNESIVPKKQVAISVINCAWEGRPIPQLKLLKGVMDTYVDKIVSMCSEFSRKGYEISLLSFCASQGDLNTAKTIESRCMLNGVTNISICHYDGEVEPVLDKMIESEIIVATRFHAMILGFMLGKSVLPIIYDEKQKYVLQDLNFFGEVCEMKDIASLDPRGIVERLVSPDSRNVYERTRARIEKAVADAEKQFAALDEILKRED